MAIRHLVIAALAALSITACGSTPVEETEEYQALAAELEQVEADVAEREAALVERETAVESAEADAEAIIADAEAQAAATIEEADAQLATVEAQVEELDANSIEPGIWLVPSELSPGQYRRVSGEGYCYIGQYKDDDILDNEGTDVGRTVFTVTDVKGSYVEISPDCGPFQKIG